MATLLYYYLRKEEYIKSLFKGTEAMKQIQMQHSQNNNNNNTVRPSPRQSSQPSKAASSTVGSFIIKNVPKSVSVNKNTVEESHQGNNGDSSSEASAVVVVGVGGVPTTKVDLSMVDDEDEASGKTCFSIAIFMSRSALDFQISQKKKHLNDYAVQGHSFLLSEIQDFFQGLPISGSTKLNENLHSRFLK